METTELEQQSAHQLIAVDRPQLEAAQSQMIEWSRAQQRACEAQLVEERTSLEIATERRWGTGALERLIGMLEKRRVFYHKIELALEAGYVIIPNFEMDLFAIRTKARAPRRETRNFGWARFPQNAQILPPGEGEYQNPLPDTVVDRTEYPDDKGGTKTETTAWPGTEFNDIEFPIALAKPVLMQRTAHAMALQVFDEVGVALDTQGARGGRRGDPIIIGRIRNPRQRPDVSFFIGWYFDTSRI